MHLHTLVYVDPPQRQSGRRRSTARSPRLLLRRLPRARSKDCSFGATSAPALNLANGAPLSARRRPLARKTRCALCLHHFVIRRVLLRLHLLRGTTTLMIDGQAGYLVDWPGQAVILLSPWKHLLGVYVSVGTSVMPNVCHHQQRARTNSYRVTVCTGCACGQIAAEATSPHR